jgi:hypothetical protein
LVRQASKVRGDGEDGEGGGGAERN